MSMDRDKLRDVLLYSLDYSVQDVESTLEALTKMTEEGKQILNEYLESGLLPDKERQGLSLREMRRKSGSDISDLALIILYDGLQGAMSNHQA